MSSGWGAREGRAKAVGRAPAPWALGEQAAYRALALRETRARMCACGSIKAPEREGIASARAHAAVLSGVTPG